MTFLIYTPDVHAKRIYRFTLARRPKGLFWAVIRQCTVEVSNSVVDYDILYKCICYTDAIIVKE